jgi:hypothetical protein
MNNHQQTERLEMRWLPVVTATGHTRMEATWVSVPTAASVPVPAVSHAA